MLRPVALMLLFAAGSLVGFADDKPKWEPPATPEGWKAVISKDGSYRFVVPKDTSRSGTRDRIVRYLATPGAIVKLRARLHACPRKSRAHSGVATRQRISSRLCFSSRASRLEPSSYQGFRHAEWPKATASQTGSATYFAPKAVDA